MILQKFGISSFEQNWQPENSVFLVFCLIKGNIFWEGHKILQNLHLTFDWHYMDKSKVEISQNFVASSEYTNFKFQDSER